MQNHTVHPAGAVLEEEATEEVHPAAESCQSSSCLNTLYPAGAVLEEEAAEEVLPAAGLVTASADYYPTVAINALMRTLRDPVMACTTPKSCGRCSTSSRCAVAHIQGAKFDLNAGFQWEHAEVIWVLFCIFTVRQGCLWG